MRWDDMSEGWEYLWLLREFREEMDESWSMCKKWFEHLQVKFVETKNIKSNTNNKKKTKYKNINLKIGLNFYHR